MSSPLPGPDAPYPPLPAPAPAATTFRQPPKSPGLAVLLSLVFPGIGQVYAGQPSRALAVFLAFVGSIYATATIDPMPFAFAIPFVFLFNLIDAYRCADAVNRRFFAGAGVLEEEEEPTPQSPGWGLTLIALGAILLMHNLGWISLEMLHRYWPVLLIVAGVVLLRGSFRTSEPPPPPPPLGGIDADDRP